MHVTAACEFSEGLLVATRSSLLLLSFAAAQSSNYTSVTFPSSPTRSTPTTRFRHYNHRVDIPADNFLYPCFIPCNCNRTAHLSYVSIQLAPNTANATRSKIYPATDPWYPPPVSLDPQIIPDFGPAWAAAHAKAQALSHYNQSRRNLTCVHVLTRYLTSKI